MSNLEKEHSPLATILGFVVGITITYLAVTIGVLIYPWLVENFGLMGAITVEIILGLNVYSVIGGGR